MSVFRIMYINKFYNKEDFVDESSDTIFRVYADTSNHSLQHLLLLVEEVRKDFSSKYLLEDREIKILAPTSEYPMQLRFKLPAWAGIPEGYKKYDY
jgi:hypothetical protein